MPEIKPLCFPLIPARPYAGLSNHPVHSNTYQNFPQTLIRPVSAFIWSLSHDELCCEGTCVCCFQPSCGAFSMMSLISHRRCSIRSYTLRFSSGSTVASMVKKHAQPPTRLETGSAQNTPSVPRHSHEAAGSSAAPRSLPFETGKKRWPFLPFRVLRTHFVR